MVRRSSSSWRRSGQAPQQGQASPAGREPGGAGGARPEPAGSEPVADRSAAGSDRAAAPSVSASGPARLAMPGGSGQLVPAPSSVSASSIVAIGRVLRAHGVHGEFKVQILCAGPEHFLECVDTGEVLLQREGLPGAFQAHVESVRLIPEGALVSLEGVETREAVEAMRGAILGLPEDRLPPCEDDTYYFHQLEGLRVVAAGDGAEIGTVVRVEESPGHDLLVVRPKAGAETGAAPVPAPVPAPEPMDDMDRMDGTDRGRVESAGDQKPDASPVPRPRRGPRKKAGDRPKSRDFFIPFVGAFVARVDLAGGCIEVTLPPGFAESQR